ncbi:MAG: preprotein translocase subunit SecG [Myxococcota bacterium]
METLLYVLHVLVCLAMLPIILLQAGKGGGVNAAFGGGGSGSVFGGSSGASSFLLKLTSGAAVLFMITSLGLSYYSSRSKSVVGDMPAQEEKSEPKTPPPPPAAPADAPAAPADAPAPGAGNPAP